MKLQSCIILKLWDVDIIVLRSTNQTTHFVLPGYNECSLNIMINTPSLFANKGAFSSCTTDDSWCSTKSSPHSLFFLIDSRAVIWSENIFPPPTVSPFPLPSPPPFFKSSSGLNWISSCEEMSPDWPVRHFGWCLTFSGHWDTAWGTGVNTHQMEVQELEMPASQDDQCFQRSSLLTLHS